MLILRIEDHDGRGCYNTRGPFNATRAHTFGECAYGAEHPSPFRSFGEDWEALYHLNSHPLFPNGKKTALFGFPSPIHYHKWFYTLKSRQILRSIGMSAAVYSVDDQYVLEADTQCIFNCEYASLFTRFECDAPLAEFLTYWREHARGAY